MDNIKKNGPWTIRKSNKVYYDYFIEVTVEEVFQPDGNPSTYSTVKMKSGVAILPVDHEGMVYLTKQFRYALQKESIEVVSGGIDQGEAPIEAAVRELKEEAGIESADLKEIGIIDLETSIIKGPVSLFLAYGLKIGRNKPEGSETIKILKLPFKEALKKVMTGEITHGPSCTVILKAHILNFDNNQLKF